MACFLHSLKYIRHVGKFSECAVFQQRKFLINCIIRYNSVAIASPGTLDHGIEKRETKETYVRRKIDNFEKSLRSNIWIPKDRIINILNNISKPGDLNSSEALMLLNAVNDALLDCSPSQRKELLQNIWNSINIYGVPISINHYNVLIDAYLENNCDFSPLDLLTEMSNKNISPNIITYERLVEYYCKVGNITSAAKVLESMKEQGFLVTENVCNALMLGRSQVDGIESVGEILKIMESNNTNVTINTYVTLMCIHAKKNDIGKIRNLISECKSKDLYFTNKHILKVARVMIANGNIEHVDEILGYLKKYEFPIYYINFTLHLIPIQHELATKLFLENLSTLKDNQFRERSVYVFLYRLIHCVEEHDKIVEICEKIKQVKVRTNPFLTAVYCSYFKGNENLTFALLKTCHQMKYPIRPHYFWPILHQKGKQHDVTGIFSVIKSMIFEYYVQPCINTVKDYVLPYCFEHKLELYKTLSKAAIPPRVIHNAIVYQLLSNHRIHGAAEYMMRFPFIYCYDILQDVLRKSYIKRSKVDEFLYICKQMYQLEYSFESDTATLCGINRISMEQQLLDFIDVHPRNKPHLIMIIQALGKEKPFITYETKNRILEHLDQSATPDIVNTLSQISMYNQNAEECVQIEKLKDMLRQMEKLRENNLVEELLESLLAEEVCKAMVIDNDTKHKDLYLTIFRYFCKYECVNLVEKCLKVLKEMFGNDNAVNLNYVSYLLKLGKIGDAFDYLAHHKANEENINKKNMQLVCEQILKREMRRQTFPNISNLFELFISSGYMTASKENINDLVRYSVSRGDLEESVKFLSSPTVRKGRPGKATFFLLKKLIMLDKRTLLQQFIDQLAEFEKKSVIVVMLFFALLECDKNAEAKRLIKIENSFDVLNVQNRLRNYVENKNITNLEKFLAISNDMPKVYKTCAFDGLFEIYVDKKDYDNALRVWKKSQEDNIEINQTVLHKFSELLEANNRDRSLHSSKSEASY